MYRVGNNQRELSLFLLAVKKIHVLFKSLTKNEKLWRPTEWVSLHFIGKI